MWFWYFILFCDCLIPLAMIIAGRMMWKHTPQKINGFIGYRTKRSMKNEDTWKFAHEYVGKLWWKIGLYTMIPSFVVHIPFYKSSDDVIGIVSTVLVVLQCVFMIGSIIPTEKAVKKNFDENGIKHHSKK